jgi:hypothetical protein
MDSVSGRVFVTWTPVAISGTAPPSPPQAWSQTLAAGDPAAVMPSAPAIGDIDGDGDDEIVVSLSGGSVFVLDPAGAFSTQVTRATGDLRGDQPSGPALGDVDGEGIMAIALWDSEYMTALDANA